MNPQNNLPNITLLDQKGNIRRKISLRSAYKMLSEGIIRLLPFNSPTVQLQETSTIKVKGKHLAQLCQPLYGNYHFYDGEQLMFNAGPRKVLWYLVRDLVEFIEEKSLKFKFSPKAIGHAGDQFYLSEKLNQCVVCKSQEGLTRHHVVPHCYRRYMALEIKNYSYHDIVLLCVHCHEKYEDEANKRKLELATKFDFPLGSIRDGNGDDYTPKENGYVVRAAAALLYHKDKIPLERQQYLLNKIVAFLGREPTQEDLLLLTKKTLQNCWKNPDEYMTHGKFVMQNTTDVQKFVEEWREHFLQVMQPQHLSTYWDKNRPIFRKVSEPNSDSPV